MMYGSGDQGKNYSSMLFYRAITDYGLISCLVNLITYSSSDTIHPLRICVLRVLLQSTFDVWSLHIPCCNILQPSTNDKGGKGRGGREKSRAGHEHEAYTWLVGEVAWFSFKKTCLSSKWQHTSLSFSPATPLLLVLKTVCLYKEIRTACYKDTGQTAQWGPLNMSGHSTWSREGHYLILPIYTKHIHTHECIHSGKKHTQTYRHAKVNELDVNQDGDERQLNTHIPSWTCYRFTCTV